MNHPKRRMALIFRWYLGLSSRWSNHGEAGRETDYQIWCGPAMGAFNAWVKGSFLEKPSNRRVVDIAENLMQGAAYLFRLQQMKTQGIHFPSPLFHFTPVPSS
jgi:trans-AT polyketide synthase/acyltransferase/oxidoreductase domain-containing protein